MTEAELSAIRERAEHGYCFDDSWCPPGTVVRHWRDDIAALLRYVDKLTAERVAERLEGEKVMLQAERDALASQLLDVAQGWVPTSERLPEKAGPVICTIRVGDMDGVCELSWSGVEWWESGRVCRFSVLAWRPLPAPYTPPKEAQDGR